MVFVASDDLGDEVPELWDVHEEILGEGEDLAEGGHELVGHQQLLGDLQICKLYF